MSLLKKPCKPTKFKVGFHSDTGGGKTFTASRIMAGLHAYAKSKKPIAFFDSEGGSDFVSETIFKPLKIELLVCKSKKFPDLCEVLKEAEKECFALIIDTVTAPWDKFKEQFLEDHKTKFISIPDWGPLKDTWRRSFTDPFINANLHIAVNGRSGSVFEQGEEMQGGKKKYVMQKVGTKMRTEGEFGYEPNVLCELDREFKDGDATFRRKCHVIKDRFDAIDSKDFYDVAFEDFLPHIQLLDLGSDLTPVDVSSQRIFDEQGDDKLSQRQRKREILCAELQALIVGFFPGRTAPEQKIKSEFLRKMFGVRAWESVEKDWKAVPLELLEKTMAVDAMEGSGLCEAEKALIAMQEEAGLAS